jgi:hypothetical protein
MGFIYVLQQSLSMDKIKAQTPRRKSNITLGRKLLKLIIESQLGIY